MWSIIGLIRSTWLRTQGLKAERPEQVNFRRRAFRAARKGDVEALREMMAEASCSGSTPLSRIVDPLTGYTLLHVAMERGSNGDCVRFLLGAGCELTQGDCSSETPLHVACMTDNAEGLAAVLEALSLIHI